MYCSRCGAQNPDGAQFCSSCGKAVQPAQPNPVQSAPVQQPSYVPSSSSPQTQPAPAPTRVASPVPKKRKTAIIIGICAVVLALILIPTGIYLYKGTQYKQAIAMMDAGEYAKARDMLQKQGNYRDASEKATECRQMLDYQAATALMEAGKLPQAKDAFDALGNFKDSATLSKACANSIGYGAAKELMEDKRYDAAASAFDELGAYEDSVKLAQQCRLFVRYEQAKALMQDGKYEEALSALQALGDFQNAEQLATQCSNKLTYDRAKAAFEQQQYYTAYVLYHSLGDYEDALSLAKACILPYPDTGELYRNPAFAKKSCSVTISAPSDGYATVLKFCKSTGEVVSVVFIEPGKKAKIRIPEGEYQIKSGYGESWFGTNELFGDAGKYYVLVFENGNTTTYDSSYIYTLTLRVSSGNVNSDDIGRNGF